MTSIVYVGNFTRPWCTEVHVAGSLEQLGHTVHRRQENEVDWPSLPADVDQVGGQLLLWTRTWPAPLEVVTPVLDELRARGVPSVSYHLDRWFGLDREHQVRDQPFFRSSLVVSPDASPRWAEEGVEHLWLPPGVYAAECGEVTPERRRWPFDVVFVGSYPYPHPEWADYREQLVASFRRRFRGRFAVLPRKGQPIRGTELQKLYASVPVVLGDSCLVGETHGYWSDRIPETLGRGGVLIHPEVRDPEGEAMVGPGGDWYEHERHLLTYPLGEFATAVELADRLLSTPDERAYLSMAGRRQVLERDTYAHRLATVLEHVEQRWGFRDVEPAPAAAPPAVAAPVLTEIGRHRGVRQPFRFTLAQGDTDRTAVREVWQDDTYRLTAADVRGRVVVDVGANVGAFSVLASALGAARVVAYEPHPATFEALRANVAAHAVARGAGLIEPRNAAVADVDGVMRLDGDGGGATLRPVGLSDVPGADVAVESVAALLGQLGARCGLLKLDCEGGEYAIVRALPFELVDVIVGEWHGPLMPHLRHLASDDDRAMVERWADHHGITTEDLEQLALEAWVERVWSPFVARLADHGRLEIFGHPKLGGTFRWRRY